MGKECTKTSMYDFMFRGFEKKRDMVALAFLHKKFTFDRFKEEADKAACAFVKYGLKKGDTITIALPNIPGAVSTLYGANKIGLVVNFVHPLVPYSRLKKTMLETKSRLLFSLDIVLDKYFNEAVNDGFKVICCKAEDWLKFPENAAIALFGKKPLKNIKKNENLIYAKDFFNTEIFDAEQDFSFDESRIIMHSGGTGGEPKSIMLTNRNFNTAAYFTIEIITSDKDARSNGEAMIAALPMFHGFGLGVTFHTVLSYGYQAVLIPKFSAKIIVKKMRKNKNVTMISGVPTMFGGIVGQKNFEGKYLSRMKFAFCGGDRLNTNLKKQFDASMIKYGAVCRLDEGYGLTETVSVVSVNQRNLEREGSVGKALGDYKVEAFDTQTGGRLERGTCGQLCVSGDVCMKGYLDNDNSQVFFEYNGDRFVKTGDLGTVDEDGFIFIKTRMKRMIKVSGVNVYPAEAEQFISKINGVKDCCVVGRPHPHKGSEAVAFVVKEAGADENPLRAEINKQCLIMLDKWTAPKEIRFVEKLPLTALGKPDYKTLEKQAENSFDAS